MFSIEEYQELGKQMREQRRKDQEYIESVRRSELSKRGIDLNTQNISKPQWDHPCTPSDGFGTVLYIASMIGSLIFKQWYLGWIVLTILYIKFITRHNND